MRLTALPPPPPTPMTLILALFSSSSLKWMRMSFSGWFLSLKSSIISTSVSAFAPVDAESVYFSVEHRAERYPTKSC